MFEVHTGHWCDSLIRFLEVHVRLVKDSRRKEEKESQVEDNSDDMGKEGEIVLDLLQSLRRC